MIEAYYRSVTEKEWQFLAEIKEIAMTLTGKNPYEIGNFKVVDKAFRNVYARRKTREQAEAALDRLVVLTAKEFEIVEDNAHEAEHD